MRRDRETDLQEELPVVDEEPVGGAGTPSGPETSTPADEGDGTEIGSGVLDLLPPLEEPEPTAEAKLPDGAGLEPTTPPDGSETGDQILSREPPRTPPDPTPLPEARRDGSFDLQTPECYLNREITWLNFNYRVLQEARDSRNPLLERVKFLSIVGSNLDEFFMKRIGGLKQQVGAGFALTTVDGRTPRDQITACYEIVRDLERLQHETCLELQGLLRDEGILRATYEDLSEGKETSCASSIWTISIPW
ncbi:MAG: hypothetical protein ACWGSQ_01270 [Longimicrobiales bacterium]